MGLYPSAAQLRRKIVELLYVRIFGFTHYGKLKHDQSLAGNGYHCVVSRAPPVYCLGGK